jgi:hypothetical protein
MWQNAIRAIPLLSLRPRYSTLPPDSHLRGSPPRLSTASVRPPRDSEERKPMPDPWLWQGPLRCCSEGYMYVSICSFACAGYLV